MRSSPDCGSSADGVGLTRRTARVGREAACSTALSPSWPYVGDGARKFDDCRSCNPWDPFTQTPGVVNHQPGESAGLGGFEPLGRFKSGPIGMAQEEDEVQLTVRYSF